MVVYGDPPLLTEHKTEMSSPSMMDFHTLNPGKNEIRFKYTKLN
jgi:hypothetical protein